MGRQTTAWKYGSRGAGRGRGRDNGCNRNKKSNNRLTAKEKDMRFAMQDQMTRGYYSTYNAVKELIITEVQKKYKYGCNIATAISCLLYTSPSPRDLSTSRMPSSA